MTNKELIKIAYELGAHPYSVGAIVSALQKGIEIGKQAKPIDEEKLDKLALKAYPLEDDAHWNRYQCELQEAYKAGYRKALEE